MTTPQSPITGEIVTADQGVMPANFPLSESELRSVGVTVADLEQVYELAQKLDIHSAQSVSEFGRNVAEHTATYADSLLEQVRCSDLEDAGDKLNQVVNAARKLNLTALSNTRSRVPLIGRWIDRFRLTKDQFVGQFNTAREQIETLVNEVSTMQENLISRVAGLQAMYGAVQEEYRLLGLHVVAGKYTLHEFRNEARKLHGRTNLSDVEMQSLNDLNNQIANLDKRIGDLLVLQQSAWQSLPTIRLIESNNILLTEKFHTIKELTVPAWKRQFMLALALNEQQNAVQLTETIDNTTNELLRRNASLLHSNTIATARANQRLVIDVDTLEKVHDALFSTVAETLKIQQEGIAARQQAAVRIQKMRTDMQKRIAEGSPVKRIAA